jgi:hypothetical protein
MGRQRSGRILSLDCKPRDHDRSHTSSPRPPTPISHERPLLAPYAFPEAPNLDVQSNPVK